MALFALSMMQNTIFKVEFVLQKFVLCIDYMKILKPNWIFGHKCMLKYVWITFSEKILQCKTFAIMLIVPITKTTHSLTLVKGQQKIKR